jgi:hypothetical protein
MSEENTWVLVDRHGDLWCVTWYIKTIHSDIEYFFETYRKVQFISGNPNSFIEDMGMELLGAL